MVYLGIVFEMEHVANYITNSHSCNYIEQWHSSTQIQCSLQINNIVCLCLWKHPVQKPTLAQLVERRTVVGIA